MSSISKLPLLKIDWTKTLPDAEQNLSQLPTLPASQAATQPMDNITKKTHSVFENFFDHELKGETSELDLPSWNFPKDVKSLKAPTVVPDAFRRLYSDTPAHAQTKLFAELQKQQKTILPNQVLLNEVPGPSLNVPSHIIGLTADSIFRFTEHIGKGGYSEVYSSLTMTRTPEMEGFKWGSPRKRVIKIAKGLTTSYEKERELLKTTLSPNSKNRKDLDQFRGIYIQSTGNQLSVHDAFDRSLDKVDYCSISEPVEYAVSYLVGALEALFALHRGGGVHRDIKGPNILVMDVLPKAALTDFGLLQRSPDQIHSTCGTDGYLAPFIFPSFDDQIRRRGKQTPAADIYAFGCTIKRDVLIPLLQQLGKAHNINVNNFVTEILPYKIPANTQNMAFGQSRPDIAFYVKRRLSQLSYIQINRNADEALSNMNKLIDLFSHVFSPKQIEALKSLSELARKMMQTEEKDVPSAHQALAELVLIKILLASPSSKMPLNFDAGNENKENNPPKKRARTQY